MKKALVCLLIVAAGCYTPKKADKQLAKAMSEYPEKVAGVCKDEFPCKPGKRDTVEKVYYDLIEVECPDYPDAVHDTIRDTLKQESIRIVKVKVPVQGKETIITQYLVDSALVKFWQSNYQKWQKESDKWQSKYKSRMNWVWALIALCVILACWLILKHRK